MGIQNTVGQRKAVVLLSGGLDSSTCLAIAAREYEVHALSIDYGSKHSKELESAKNLARYFSVVSHRIVSVNLGTIGGSSLTDDSIKLDTGKELESIGREIPTSYVPARNMTFLSLAVGLAEVVGAEKIFIGANAVDYSGYPDCRPEFFDAFQRAADMGTKAGVEGHPIEIEVPLLKITKAEIIRKGLELGVPYELTWTCYSGGERACGKCEACLLRLEGFREAGVHDPIEYED